MSTTMQDLLAHIPEPTVRGFDFDEGDTRTSSPSRAKEIALVEVTSQMSGVEFSTLFLAQHLDRTRWNPMVICPEEGDLPARARSAGISVAIVPRPRLLSTSVRIAGRTIPNPFALVADSVAIIASARALARFLRARRPALVVTKGLLAHFYGGLAARWVGVPCVWHVQDRVSDRAGPLFPWTLSLFGRWLAREIVADAQSIARQLEQFIPRERITVIWNGVDTNEFSPGIDGSSIRGEWSVGAGDLLIGSIARLTAWKGQHILVDAFARIAGQFPNARLVLVGSALFDTDLYARTLKAQVARLGIEERVIFAGFRRDMPQVLAALDIVAHTSLEKDSAPLAVVSAMAAGKAIVCSQIDGTAELFENGVDGLLVPPGNPDALSKKLGLLLSDSEFKSRLGRAARAKAQRCFSVERFAGQCETVFGRALA